MGEYRGGGGERGSAVARIDLRSAHTAASAASRRRATEKQMMLNTASLLHGQEIQPTHAHRVSPRVA